MLRAGLVASTSPLNMTRVAASRRLLPSSMPSTASNGASRRCTSRRLARRALTTRRHRYQAMHAILSKLHGAGGVLTPKPAGDAGLAMDACAGRHRRRGQPGGHRRAAWRGARHGWRYAILGLAEHGTGSTPCRRRSPAAQPPASGARHPTTPYPGTSSNSASGSRNTRRG